MRYVLLCALLCVIRIEVSALQVFHSASNWLTLGTLYFIFIYEVLEPQVEVPYTLY